MTASSFAYHTGRMVGKYKLESLIGRGGMAEVYRSHHPELGRELAIKIVHPFLTDTPALWNGSAAKPVLPRPCATPASSRSTTST
ncbi:MAG: hypothetical protein IPL78_32905 [Chloroflexi bacterium]|nr:hypothetical protein [Chloroflexota bacterium]